MSATPSTSVREQAEAWHARLMAPNCFGHEREAFERWRSNPANAEAYAATERLLAGVDTLSSDPRMEALMQLARRRPASPARRPRRWGSWAAAASVMLAVALGLRYGPALLAEPEPVEYAAADEGRTITLADGSTAQLDVASRIDVRMGRRQRRIELVEGRVLFDVAHDAARPFVVQAGNGSVTALGTRFQVQRGNGGVTVTLAEGSVAVTRVTLGGDRHQTRLQPGEQLSWVGAGAGWTLRATDTEAELGWTRGRLIFRRTPLAEVVVEVNRYSARKLVLADETLGELPVHGNFIAGDAAAVVAALDAVLPVRAEAGEHEIRLYRR